MISQALTLLRNELNTYLQAQPSEGGVTVELASVTDTGSGNDRVVLSLVSLEEEAALKNSSPYQRTAAGFELVNPPVFLNLFVLITSYSTSYETALRRLAWIIQCFQQRPQLVPTGSLGGDAAEEARAALMRLSLQLYPLSFEKANQLWSVFGGKQLPSVLYKVRLVEEQGPASQGTASFITTIETQLHSQASAA